MKKVDYIAEESFGYHINGLSSIITRMMEAELKPYNLTYLQFSILINIYLERVTSQKDMLKFTSGDEAGITRLINRLESKGYIMRVPCVEDKRRKRLELSTMGLELIEEIKGCMARVNAKIVEGLDENETRLMLKLLQKVHSSLSE